MFPQEHFINVNRSTLSEDVVVSSEEKGIETSRVAAVVRF